MEVILWRWDLHPRKLANLWGGVQHRGFRCEKRQTAVGTERKRKALQLFRWSPPEEVEQTENVPLLAEAIEIGLRMAHCSTPAIHQDRSHLRPRRESRRARQLVKAREHVLRERGLHKLKAIRR